MSNYPSQIAFHGKLPDSSLFPLFKMWFHDIIADFAILDNDDYTLDVDTVTGDITLLFREPITNENGTFVATGILYALTRTTFGNDNTYHVTE